ncbi:CCAAT-box-binding transcription factor [Phytophthora cinnamomi]|uniref:CCAAT-box-binding transcription factor n=1 Tax=Phytophthora cinnamomi TaxID=4785 RepID=UPI00355A89E0|nr:CCAAT-box-binding transcription factor [Phytophthora cinnamomi]
MAKEGKTSAASAAARGAHKQDKKHVASKQTSVANSSRKNQAKSSPAGGDQATQSPRSGNLSQLVALLGEGVAWHDAEPKLKPRLKHKSAAEPLQAADELVLALKKQAQALLEAEVARFDALKSGKMSSDDKYLATMMKSGTLADRVAALTLTSQASPLHSLVRVGQLISMASKKARRESLMAVDSLKDLFLNNLLPDEAKLRFFHQHPLQAARDSPAHLVLWFFEHCLKTAYAQLTAVLAAGMDDAVDSHKRACLRAANALLRAKPEQEAVLLAMLVNKLGDPDRKIAAYLHRMLQELLREHPAMKRVVVDEVERLLTRTKVSDRAKYNAVLFLNQIYLEGDGVDVDLAGHLISVYFGLFSKEVHRHDEEKEKSKKNTKDAKNSKKGKKKKSAAPTSDEAMDRKLLSALLVGVNRAFPYANATSANFTQEIDSLFQVVHRAHHSTSVQALMLLFQVMSSTNSVSDRFYTALYGKLIDPKVRETSKHTLFLNLIFRAMKADVSPARAGAFTKRLLQLASVMPPAFTCAVLFLLSELLKVKPQLRTLLDQPEAGSASGNAADDEHFEDVKTDEENPAFELEKEESDDDDDDTTEDAGSSKLNDGLTDAERSAKVLAQMFGKPEKESKKSKESAVVSFDDEPAAKTASSKKGNDKEEGGYDASKRNPLFAGAETSCAWEIQMLAHHYHPSVQSFTRQLLDNKDTGIQYAGDPLVDFTMHAFFEKFVNKKPRHKVAEASGNNGAKAKNWTFAPINTEAVLQENEANVDASDQFFYKFFKERASRDVENPRRKKKSKSDRDADAFSDMEDGDEDDEEIDAYAQELAEGIMEDGNHDDEDPDMAGWSDSDDEEEPTLEGEDEEMEEASGMAADEDDDNDDDANGEEGQEDDDDDEEDDDDAFDFSVMGGMDDDDEVLQEELQALDAKRKRQTPPKAGDKRKSMFASADDYDQIVKEAMAKQAKSDKQSGGKKSKKPRRS